MAVATDNEVCLPNDGTFDNRVIVWIGCNDVQNARDRDDLGEGANFIGDLGGLCRVQAALELKFLGKFGQNGFASDGEALAVAGCLHTMIRVPQPAD